jgi:hypothetical protein
MTLRLSLNSPQYLMHSARFVGVVISIDPSLPALFKISIFLSFGHLDYFT